jgi:hypothetical protein
MRPIMRTVIDPMDWSKHTVPSEYGPVVELDGSLSSAETLWRMVVAMASKDRAWCIQYDVNHPLRLMYVTSWQVYGLVPPPDEMADLIVRAIDRVTRPRSIWRQVLLRTVLNRAGRGTRSFWVKHEEALIRWVASWPRRASDGPVLLFRETYPGPDPSLAASSECGPP